MTLASPGSPTPKAKSQKTRVKKPPTSPSPKIFRSARLQEKHERALARPDSSSQGKIEDISTASPVSAIKLQREAPTYVTRQNQEDMVVPPPKKRAQSKGEFATRSANSLPYGISTTTIAGVTSTHAVNAFSLSQEVSKYSPSLPPPITPPSKKKQAGHKRLDFEPPRNVGSHMEGTTASGF